MRRIYIYSITPLYMEINNKRIVEAKTSLGNYIVQMEQEELERFEKNRYPPVLGYLIADKELRLA